MLQHTKSSPFTVGERTTSQGVVNLVFYAIAAMIIVFAGYQINSLNQRLETAESMYDGTRSALQETQETLRIREDRIALLERQQRTLDFRITGLEREVSQILRGNR